MSTSYDSSLLELVQATGIMLVALCVLTGVGLAAMIAFNLYALLWDGQAARRSAIGYHAASRAMRMTAASSCGMGALFAYSALISVGQLQKLLIAWAVFSIAVSVLLLPVRALLLLLGCELRVRLRRRNEVEALEELWRLPIADSKQSSRQSPARE